jgi:hypothetical protein
VRERRGSPGVRVRGPRHGQLEGRDEVPRPAAPGAGDAGRGPEVLRARLAVGAPSRS